MNPFKYTSPELIKPNDVIDLFVSVFSEYSHIPKVGHTFINGSRGSGKSMMFRFMEPDCQRFIDQSGKRLKSQKPISELEYLAIYAPIKIGQYDIQELDLNAKGVYLLNEHLMCINIATDVIKTLKKIGIENTASNIQDLKKFAQNEFQDELYFAGCEEVIEVNEIESVEKILDELSLTLRRVSSSFKRNYLNKLIGIIEPIPYDGPILLFRDFVLNMIRGLKKYDFFPSCPVYLLVDDADELNNYQKKILNTWVSIRSTKDLSLKISTSHKYHIYTTTKNSRIDTPHDYSEVNLNDIYTTKKDLYYMRVHEIVRKRLKVYSDKSIQPEVYFPSDSIQEEQIAKIFQQYIETKLAEGKSKDQAYDFAYRYARPDFIKNLKGNRYTFSYAGFDQLVNISSGVIRQFIEFASLMYDDQSKGEEIEFISDSIQNKVIKEYSDDKMTKEFDKDSDNSESKHDIYKLRNLILGMGGLFKMILNSSVSERRVFSIALNNEPNEELKRILNLGVQLGYIQKSLIGNKYGTGKARLYVLNRILSPHFGLDPSSFAGYKFMDAENLVLAIKDPNKFNAIYKNKIQADEENSNDLFNTKE